MKKSIKIFLIITFALFCNGFVYSQVKQDSTSLLFKVKNYFVTTEVDSPGFFILNTFNRIDKAKITRILKGFYLSGFSTQKEYSFDAINEISFMPLYSESSMKDVIGFEIASVFNPLVISINYTQGEADLAKLKTFISRPPVNPDLSPFDETLKFKALSVSTGYITSALFWGRVFPIIGISASANDLSIAGNSKIFPSLGISGELLIKQRNIFISFQYIKQLINTEYFSDQTVIKAGIFFRI